eukprot:13600560-Heterocapsa_arctica.AAC.1
MNSADLQNRQVTHEREMVVQSLHEEMNNRDVLNTAIAKNRRPKLRASQRTWPVCDVGWIVRAAAPLNP